MFALQAIQPEFKCILKITFGSNVILAIIVQNMKHLCQKHISVRQSLINILPKGHRGDIERYL